jgi:hypothetical protein
VVVGGAITSIILIDEQFVPEKERDDLAKVNNELEVLAARRLSIIDPSDEPYCKSKIAWKIAVFSNAMVHRFISLAEGVALSWNNSHILSAVLNARAISETVAIYGSSIDGSRSSAKCSISLRSMISR